MRLNVTADKGMVSIDVKQAVNPQFEFFYSTIFNMYANPPRDGEGCQVMDEALRADIETLGRQMAQALAEFGRKHPDSGILSPRLTTEVVVEAEPV